MGRPLFSTLIEPAVRVAEPVYAEDVVKGAGGAVCERWSISNPFDPDDDAFFDDEHAVYEAFLSDDEVRAQAARSALPPRQSARGARVGLPGTSASELIEQRRRLAELDTIRVPFEDVLGVDQDRADQTRETLFSGGAHQYVIPAETMRSRRAVPIRVEDGLGLPRSGHAGVRARVLDRMRSGDAQTVVTSALPSAPDTTVFSEGPNGRVNVSWGDVPTRVQPDYPIRSAYTEERIRETREQQERNFQDAQRRIQDARDDAERYLRSVNTDPEQRRARLREVQRNRAEIHERRRLLQQGVRGQRHVDDMVDRIREGTARSASLIQQNPDSIEARELREALSEADAMLTETLRRDDEMREEIRVSQARMEHTPGSRERADRLRADQSRHITLNTNLGPLPHADALSPSSIAASATSSSGSSRIVAPRMARSPISPSGPISFREFALQPSRRRSRREPQQDLEAVDDDMPGLLDVGHSSEEEGSLSSNTDSSSDWGTDFSGRSSPAEVRSLINPPSLVTPRSRSVMPEVDFEDEGMEWDPYYDLTRGIQRSPSPDQLNLTSEAQVEEALLATDVVSMPIPPVLDARERSPSPTFFSTTPIPIPMSPSSRSHTRNASSGTPGAAGALSMTPPASVTPRFLTWGVRSGSPPPPSATSPVSPTSNRRRRTSTTPVWLSQTSNWNAF